MQYIIGRHNVDDDGVPAGGTTTGVGVHIEWQNGPLREQGTDEPAEPNGAFVEGVIEAAIDRMEFYQSTRFACAENDEILGNLRSALVWCHARTANRTAQGVEGTHEVHTSPAVPSVQTPVQSSDVVPMTAVNDQPQQEPPLEPAVGDL